MREILFKAKRIDNGEWVEGNFAKGRWYLDEKERCIILPLDLCFYPYCEVSEWIEVDPDTLCQYTGLKDKNDKRIWENDIVKINRFLFDGSEYENEIIVSIEYMSEMMCFGANMIKAKEIKRYMGYEDECAEKVVIPFNDLYGLHEESFEVIGNIFDNPELLAEG